MSDSGRSDKKPISAYQRWEMASFDPPPPPDPVRENKLAQEIQRIRAAAHQQGLASGHVAGQAIGYQAGFDQGHAQGFEKGRQEALAEAAHLAGLADGFKAIGETREVRGFGQRFLTAFFEALGMPLVETGLIADRLASDMAGGQPLLMRGRANALDLLRELVLADGIGRGRRVERSHLPALVRRDGLLVRAA